MAYNADSIKVRDFRTACRATPGMYLGADGQDAVFNCFLEILNNSCDEAIMGRGNTIIVEVLEDGIKITDMGAGVPRGKNKDCDEVLIELYTSAHSSGKFDSSNYERVRGVHGVGSSAVCVCSEIFEVWSKRDGGEWHLLFKEGIPQDSAARKLRNTTETGTTVYFKPNKEIFHIDNDTPSFDIERIRSELELTSYFIPNVTFILRANGKEEKFLSKNGLKDFAVSRIKKPLHKNYIYDAKHFDGNIDIEVFAQWTAGKEKCYVFSNGALNSAGGTPVTGMKTAFTRTINDLSKNNFESDAIRKGLVTIINVKHPHPIYQNQIKDKIQNVELRGYTQTVFTEAIKDFILKNRSDFDTIISILEKDQKAEEAAQKAREAFLAYEKDAANTAKKKFSAPIKLCDCEKHGENSILYICEGTSAKGSIQNARNLTMEAVYDIKGKIISALKNPIDEVLKNQEVRDILQIMGCGILEKYDSKKLNFGKLLIFSDRDEDGSAISNLIVTLLFVLMPDFIKEKRLGRVIPPLFKLTKGKNKVYFYSNAEYLAEKEKYKGWEVTRFKGIGEMSSQDMKNTMFNEKERRIEMYCANNFEDFSDLILLLMGEEVAPRKEYIFENIDFHKLRSE